MPRKRIDRLISKVVTMNGDEKNFYLTPSGDELVIGVGQESDIGDISTRILTINSTSGSLSGSFTGSFSGDGAGITGVAAEWGGSRDGNANITGSLYVTQTISGSTLTGSNIEATNITGSVVSASNFYGDGTGITGVTGEWDGSHAGNANITGSLYVTQTISGSTLTGSSIEATNITGSIISASNFYGDGSGITGVTGEWDGSHTGNASITGSLWVSGSLYVGHQDADVPAVNETVSVRDKDNANNANTFLLWGSASSPSLLGVGDSYLSLGHAGENTASISAGVYGSGYDSDLAIYTSLASDSPDEQERVRIRANGNVGIGTTTPQVPLDVIDMGGIVLSQTIIDGVATGFSCETNSTTYKQINDDIDDTKKASVTFTVPASNKVWVSMKTSIRDFDSTEKIFYVRVTDSDSESTQGSWGAGNFNDEQVSGYYEEDFSIHIFQWYFDGSYTSLNWSPGETKTMYFQIKVQGATEQVSVKAGGASYGPMSVTAESVPNNVNFVDMD